MRSSARRSDCSSSYWRLVATSSPALLRRTSRLPASTRAASPTPAGARDVMVSQGAATGAGAGAVAEIGRESGRVSGCQYVWISGGAGSINKKQHTLELIITYTMT